MIEFNSKLNQVGLTTLRTALPTTNQQLNVIFTSSDLFKLNLYKNKIELVRRLNTELATFKNQTEAAKFLGTYQPVVSNLKNLEVDNMNIELILEYLSKFEINFKIKNVDGQLFFKAE